MFAEDFEALLNGHSPERVPFKLFADTYHLHSSGPSAMKSVRFEVKRLKGLSKHSQSLWPIAKSPGWLGGGDDRGWTAYDGRVGRPEERLSFDTEEGRPRGIAIRREEKIPSLVTLKAERSVEMSTVVKAAIALFNVEATGQRHAIFANLDAARTWPFLEPWIAERLPNPMNIAGPTIACTINCIPIDGSTVVSDLLQQMQEDQVKLSEHAHAPWSIMKQQISVRDGHVMDDVARRQVFNWQAPRRPPKRRFSFLEHIGGKGWPDYGTYWQFGLTDEHTLSAMLGYDDAHLRHGEAQAALDRTLEIILWLLEPLNWLRPVETLQDKH